MPVLALRRSAVAIALLAASVGAPIAAVSPASAQVTLTIKAKASEFPLATGEKVRLGNLLSVVGTVAGAQSLQIDARASSGVQINGVAGNGDFNVRFASLNEALDAFVTATASGDVSLRIRALDPPSGTVKAEFSGSAVIKVVGSSSASASTASLPLLFTPTPSPPTITVGERVPLSAFVSVTPSPAFTLNAITVIAFQASGGVQVNGLSSGSVPPALESLQAATVTATSAGSVTITIAAVATPLGTLQPLQITSPGTVQVKFAQPATSAAPSGGANRPPVAQSVQVIAKAGTSTRLVLKASDPDATPVTYAIVELPEHGRLSGKAPNLTYTPSSGFRGTDAFTFTASDGATSSAEATVTITVTGKAATAKPTKKATTKKATKTR